MGKGKKGGKDAQREGLEDSEEDVRPPREDT